MLNLKLYIFLVGLMITDLLICDVLAFDVISIDGYNFAASGLIFPLSFLLASIITEVYGFNLAGRIVWVQLVCQALFILIINFFVLLPTPTTSTTAMHYFQLYHNLWHVLVASTMAVSSAYFINDCIISKLKIYLSGRYFMIRFILSNAFSNAILVSISYPINFYGQYDIAHITIIALNTWVYKMAVAFLLLPAAILLANLVKKVERIDYFDYGVSYNPLKVFSADILGENKYAFKKY